MSETRQLNEAVRPLVWRARAGDAGAFTRLVGRCAAPIHRWALGLTGDVDDADDVTQEVLIALHWKLRGYEDRSQFTTWLYRITRNAALGLLRRRRRRTRRQRRALREHPWRCDTEDPTTAESARLRALHIADVADLVRTFFEELPRRQREVFDLVDLQGYTPTEAADMLDMKAVTARAHLFRARRAIRAAILERRPEIAEDHSR